VLTLPDAARQLNDPTPLTVQISSPLQQLKTSEK